MSNYDAQGRLASLTNWSDYPLQGARVTRWNYKAHRGWLTSKQYPDGMGPGYSYSPAGRLTSRVWARPVQISKALNGSTHSLDRFSRTEGALDFEKSCLANAFRKACRFQFSSHPPALHWHRKSPRTCFEGPFGEVLRATGPMAVAIPFRFSTKYQDDETDLLYYGVRYLKTSTGGWLSRDPIGEKGGMNLYGFVRNDPISLFDKLGQSIGIPTCGYGCVPSPTCASPDSTDCGIFADLLNRWRTGYSGLYEIPDDAMGRMMERGQNKTDIEQMKNLLRARCKQFNKRASNGAMDQIVHDSFTSAGAECEAWYLGGHTRVVSGFGDCCSGKAQICLEVTDKFDFDEQDPWPSGGMLDKLKYLGSICTGAIINFPYPTWSYANIPVHGKKCIQVRL